MKKTLLVFALFSAAIGSAQAADMPLKAPVVVAPFTWTGVYLGINAGYGNNTSDGASYCTTATGVASGTGCWPSAPSGISPSGGFVGGQVGANYQVGLFVFGIEGDIQVAHINDSNTFTTPCCIPGFTGANSVWTRSQNMDWFGTVRGRLGLAIWDRTLIYGTGGLMYAEEVVNSNLGSPQPTVPAVVNYQGTSSGTHSGWVAGGGLEYAFTKNLSAKVEGLYYNLGSENVTAFALNVPTNHFTDTTSFTYKGAMVRLGANLKFGP
jgi:outer membrane immunogenic protein